MEQWNDFEFNEPYDGPEISSINGISLPKQYIEFIKKHNGGEGDIGESWLILYPIEELQEINDDYEIQEYLPGNIIIGGDGGGELYGINLEGYYFNAPSIGDEDDIRFLGNNIDELPNRINELWSE